jgi:regulator of protease activity HflC (stomatin/prohibitin superfamily)
MIYLILFLVVIIAVITALILFKGIFMVDQAQAAVIERLGKFNRVVTSGLHLKIPFIEKFRVVGFINRPEFRNNFGAYRVDLREQIYDIVKQRVITKDNVRIEVDTIIYYRVTHPEKTVYGITDLPKALEQLALTNIRNEFGRMDLDISLGARTEINQNLKISLAEASEDWGIEILRVEVQEIIPPADLEEPMEKQMVAERERRAKVLAAQAEKETLILMAEGTKEQAILEGEASKAREVLKAEAEKEKIILAAEAERQQMVLLAQGKREALLLESEGEKSARLNLAEAEAVEIMKRLQAQAEGLAEISKALSSQEPNNALIALKSLEAAVQIAEKLAQGQATKLIIPQEASGLMGSLLGIAEGIKALKNN